MSFVKRLLTQFAFPKSKFWSSKKVTGVPIILIYKISIINIKKRTLNAVQSMSSEFMPGVLQFSVIETHGEATKSSEEA